MNKILCSNAGWVIDIVVLTLYLYLSPKMSNYIAKERKPET